MKGLFFSIYGMDVFGEYIDGNLLMLPHLRDFNYEEGMPFLNYRIKVFKGFNYIANFCYQFGKDIVINYEESTINIRTWNLDPGDGTTYPV